MTGKTSIDRYLARYPWGGVMIYAALLSVFVLIAWSAASDIFERRAAIAAATEQLAQLQEYRPQASTAAGSTEAAPTGSPFLEGPTVTVAGAALLQRITNAIAQVGGSVESTQIELPGTQSKTGHIAVIASCEVAQPELQKLLFDLESGMPFLFIDQLVVQPPAASLVQLQGRLRVQLTISGHWQGGK